MPYLHNIGLENFRLFKDRTVFELAPITILTGTNSSGKSSLIKSLQLMKSSLAESNSLEELSFSRGKHNLGWYGQVLNRDSKGHDLVFTFDLELNGIITKTFIEFTYTAPHRESFAGDLVRIKVFAESGEVVFQITKGELRERHVSFGSTSFKQKYRDFHVKMDFLFLINELARTYNKNIVTNSTPLSNEAQNSKLLEKYLKRINEKGRDILEQQRTNIFDAYFLRFMFNRTFRNDEEEFSPKLVLSKEDSMLLINRLERIKNKGVSFEHTNIEQNVFEDFFDFGIDNVIRFLDLDSDTIVLGDEGNRKKDTPELTKFGKFLFDEFLANEFSNSISKVKEMLKNVESLSSFRANTDRLYHSNSEIVEINRLLWDFSIRNPQQYKSIKGFLEDSLRLFGIGDEIVIKHHQGVSSEILVLKDGNETLLADLGFGYSQLVPILLKICLIVVEKYKKDILTLNLDPTIFLLEEPESNLHPSLQSKLAELICDAAERFNIQFIVETHSEYMIRNFQYLTATKKLKTDDTTIYYFHKPRSKEFEESPYRRIQILEDGRLSKEFGEGFFDEIPRLLAFLYNSSFN